MSELDDILARAASEDLDDARMGEVGLICRTNGVPTPEWVVVENILLRAQAGEAVQYNDELAGKTRPDLAYGHAILSGGSLPALDGTGAEGYDLTHRVFYSSNFGEISLTDSGVVSQLQDEYDAASLDLKIEILCCLEILGAASQAVITMDIDNDDIHTVLAYGLLLGLRS